MEPYILLILISTVVLGASFIQSVTGFGFGIFAMIFLPNLLLYTEANILSSMLSLFTSLSVALVMWRKINTKNLVFPLIGCLFATYFAVEFIGSQDNRTLILLLGIVLVLLSIYFFFFSHKIKIKPTWYAGLIAGILSGIMGGMFAIGGPPVVIYFLQSEEDTDGYLATISAYFVLSGIINVTTKAAKGFITTNVWLAFALGFIAMALGALIGKFAREKCNSNMIKKAVYGFMAISGIMNIVTCLI